MLLIIISYVGMMMVMTRLMVGKMRRGGEASAIAMAIAERASFLVH